MSAYIKAQKKSHLSFFENYLSPFSLYRFCSDPDGRVRSLDDLKRPLPFFSGVDWEHIRERPAAIPIEVRYGLA